MGLLDGAKEIFNEAKELIGADGDGNGGTPASSVGKSALDGIIGLATGTPQQLEASKYQINAGDRQADNSQLFTVLGFLGVILIIAVIALAYTLK